MPWSLADAARGVLLVFSIALVLIVAGGALTVLLADTPAQGIPGLVMTLALEGSLVLSVAVFSVWKYRQPWAVLGFSPGAKGGRLLAVAAFGGIAGFSFIYSAAVSALGWDALLPPGLPPSFMHGAAQKLLAFLVTVVAAPLGEEVFFRGFLLPALAARWGFLLGTLASSALFAFSHVAPGLLLPAFASGILLAWVYRRTGSLWNCILAHGIQNTLAFLALLAGA